MTTITNTRQNCADVIDIESVHTISRCAVELNNRARLGLPLIIPDEMKQAIRRYTEDLTRLEARRGGFCVVNSKKLDVVAEKSATECIESIEMPKDVEQFKHALDSFERALRTIFSCKGIGPNSPIKYNLPKKHGKDDSGSRRRKPVRKSESACKQPAALHETAVQP